MKCRFCLKEEKEKKLHLIHIHIDVNILKERIKHLGGGGCANFRFAQAVFGAARMCHCLIFRSLYHWGVLQLAAIVIWSLYNCRWLYLQGDTACTSVIHSCKRNREKNRNYSKQSCDMTTSVLHIVIPVLICTLATLLNGVLVFLVYIHFYCLWEAALSPWMRSKSITFSPLLWNL